MFRLPFQSLGLAVVAALTGFSFALATAPDQTTSRGTSESPRAVGSGLRISNPLLLAGQDPLYPSGGGAGSSPKGFDLGDACYGSQIVRYITAVGGIEPWLFTGNTVGTTGLKVEAIGRVVGMLPPVVGTSISHITATVSDRAGGSQTGVFSIFGFTSATTPFRFAIDRLSDARVGQDYLTNIQVLNNDPSNTVFTTVPGSVTVNGVVQPDLYTVGLQLFQDGSLAGRPLMSGTIAFVARATSLGGKTALNRKGSAPDQPLSIMVEVPKTIQSILATSSSTITINANRPGHDGLNLVAFYNSDGLFSSDFAGKILTLRVGVKTFSAQLDGNGELHGRGVPFQVRNKAPKGQFSIGLRNQFFADLFGPSTSLADGSLRVVPVELQIGDQYLGSEAIEYSVRNRRGREQLHYTLLRSRQVGGLCQILNLKGINFGGNTVAFKTDVLVAPLAAQGTTLANASSATVNIGPKFTEQLVLFNGKGRFPPPGIASFKIHGKVATITTYGLASTDTGITPASQNNNATQDFLLGLQINAGSTQFNGEATRRIFPF